MVWKNKFHERINQLWKHAKEQNRKITQTEYAKRLGVTRNALMGWLRGSGQPDVDGLVRIATRENVSLAWLRGDERPRTENELLQDEQALVMNITVVGSIAVCSLEPPVRNYNMLARAIRAQ